MDRDRVAELLEERRPVLLVYIRAIVGVRGACEDILQEAAITCLDKCAEVPDEAAFEGWVRTVCRYKSLQHLEKNRRERPADAARLAELCTAELADAAAEVEDERLPALRDCLERLAPGARQLVHLRYAQELPGEEIARRLERPVNTVYVTLCRLHKALADCVRGRLSREGL